MDTDLVGTLSEIFDIQGEGFTVGGASAGGNVAIIQASRLIKQEVVDVCMVIGALADLSPMELQGFYNVGALGGQNLYDTPNKASRPFDKYRDGFVWGQSCGCLILESNNCKRFDSMNIWGEIIGFAIALDAQRSSTPNFEGESRAMKKAIESAGVELSDIQYINAHGTASILGDETEVAAIRHVFGEKAQNIWVNSTKGLIGHGLWSAGVVEAIATILQLKNGFIHANPNLEESIDNVCKFVGQNSEKVNIHTALSNSFGFAGINTSIVISVANASLRSKLLKGAYDGGAEQ